MTAGEAPMGTHIHPTAIIMPGAEIGENCRIGAYSIIGDMARIGAGSEIGAHCEIGVQKGVLPEGPLRIGEGAIIRSGSVFYQNSRFGAGLRTGHRVVVREGVQAGESLQIGTLSDLQGHCIIGDYVRCHSNVHIGMKSEIRNFVRIYPFVVLTNDPHPPSDVLNGCVIEEFAVIATNSTVLPGCRIGRGALIGAMTLVRQDVPEDTICIGVPGRNVGSTSKIRLKDDGKPAYPWRRHFHRGYPEAVVAAWKREFQ